MSFEGMQLRLAFIQFIVAAKFRLVDVTMTMRWGS